LKDYIGAPKENGYRSIHTVVYPLPNISQQPMEIQIRTKEMHEECAFGLASHAQYKQWLYTLNSSQSRANLLRNLQNLRAEVRTPEQFEQSLRTYFREDQIVLFDENETIYHVASPASALDFVCHTHPSRVCRLKSIRVNGRERPFSHRLHDGDVVTSAFSKKRTFRSAWGSACLHAASRKRFEARD
jgi:GTP pyrophosphokinase